VNDNQPLMRPLDWAEPGDRFQFTLAEHFVDRSPVWLDCGWYLVVDFQRLEHGQFRYSVMPCAAPEGQHG
jgi:hypothetical protein